jgi:hypothetical protein
MTANQIIAISAVAALILSAMAIAVTIRSLRDQLWLQTFAEYTRRYSDIVTDLPSESRSPDSDFSIESLHQDEQGPFLNRVRAYVNLCSEELYLRRHKRIDKETWSIWTEGIEATVALPWFRSGWPALRREYSFFPEFCVFVDECIEEGSTRLREGEGSAPPA